MPYSPACRFAPFLVLALLPSLAGAQDGYLDTSFSGDGALRIEFPNYFTGEAAGSLALPDGRLVVYGQECAVDCNPAAARLLPNGDFDSTWSADGKVVFTYADAPGGTGLAALQPDGKVVFAGQVQVGDELHLGLARLTSQGLFDPSFGAGGTPGSIRYSHPGGADLYDVTAIAIAPDGKIVVGGAAAQPGFIDSDFFIARFTSAGQLDSGFSSDGVAWVAFDFPPAKSDGIRDLAVQPDGRILAFGTAHADIGVTDLAFARLTTTGALDNTFDGDSGTGNGKFVWDVTDLFGDVNDWGHAVALQTDGRILFAGRYHGQGEPLVYHFGRLLADGASDPALTLRGSLSQNDDILQQPGGPILLTGSRFVEGQVACMVERWNADATDLDLSFAGTGSILIPFGDGDTDCWSIALSGANIVLAGAYREPDPSVDVDFHVVRLRGSLFSDNFERGDTEAWSSTSP